MLDDQTLNTIIITLIVIILWFIFTYLKSPKNLPPGPKGLPYFGYLPFLGAKPLDTLTLLKRKYGDIYTIYLGRERVVVLTSYKLIKEALHKSTFEERPAGFREKAKFATENGLESGFGAPRIHLRRFTVSTLRNFGMGKASLEPKIQDEIYNAIEQIRKFNGKPAYLQDLLTMSITNIMVSILFGKRMEYKDPKFQELLTTSKDAMDSIGINQWSNLLPEFVINFLGIKTTSYYTNLFYNKISNVVKECEKNQAHTNNQNNFMEVWREEAEKSNENMANFNEPKLIQVMAELFMGGSDTTTNTIEWALLFLIKNPKAQKKLQEEIDNVIGSNRTPTMSDQKLMPYTEATIMEVTRIMSLAPLAEPHMATEDTTLNGYNIPKDTTIYPNLWAVHRDPDVFPEPECFKPERFITEDNKIKLVDELIPFSTGKRQCPGESLARMQLFLYITNLFQHFTFTKEDAVVLDYEFGLALKPISQKMCAVAR